MGKWNPGDRIVGSEPVARRLFDEPILFGAFDQPQFKGLQIKNFQENRGKEFSVDRLGASSCDKMVVGYLQPRAIHAAGKYQKPKQFCGWIYVTAKLLIKPNGGAPYEVVASPVKEEGAEWVTDDLRQNRYHAHVVIPADVGAELFAFRIRELFMKNGAVQPAEGLTEEQKAKLLANTDRPSTTWSRLIRSMSDAARGLWDTFMPPRS